MKQHSEASNAQTAASAGLGRNAGLSEASHASGYYTVECRDAEGNLKWVDDIHNLVTNQGGANMLDNHLSGSAYTAAWYMGLIDSTSYVAGVVVGDTAASHGGWVESTAYSQANRPTAAFSAASGKSKALSSALVFTMNAGATIKGCFLQSTNTKGGTTGVLFSCGLFTGGDKVVQSGDTLSVSYTATV